MTAGAPAASPTWPASAWTGCAAVGERRAAALAAVGVETVFDLLTTYPRRYLDRTRRVDLSDLAVGDEAVVFAEVTARRARAARARAARWSRRRRDRRRVDARRLLQPALARAPAGRRGPGALLRASSTEYRGRRQMINPVVDVVVGADGDERDPTRRCGVIAGLPGVADGGLTSWELRARAPRRSRAPARSPTRSTPRSLARLALIDRTGAYWQIHRPVDLADTDAARRRLVFDELLRLQLLLALRRRRVRGERRGDRATRSTPPTSTWRPARCRRRRRRCCARFLAGHRLRARRAPSAGSSPRSPPTWPRRCRCTACCRATSDRARPLVATGHAARRRRRRPPGRAHGPDRGPRRAARRVAARATSRASSSPTTRALGGVATARRSSCSPGGCARKERRRRARAARARRGRPRRRHARAAHRRRALRRPGRRRHRRAAPLRGRAARRAARQGPRRTRPRPPTPTCWS